MSITGTAVTESIVCSDHASMLFFTFAAAHQKCIKWVVLVAHLVDLVVPSEGLGPSTAFCPLAVLVCHSLFIYIIIKQRAWSTVTCILCVVTEAVSASCQSLIESRRKIWFTRTPHPLLLPCLRSKAHNEQSEWNNYCSKTDDKAFLHVETKPLVNRKSTFVGNGRTFTRHLCLLLASGCKPCILNHPAGLWSLHRLTKDSVARKISVVFGNLPDKQRH